MFVTFYSSMGSKSSTIGTFWNSKNLFFNLLFFGHIQQFLVFQCYREEILKIIHLNIVIASENAWLPYCVSTYELRWMASHEWYMKYNNTSLSYEIMVWWERWPLLSVWWPHI